jgi:hypothetical protein
MRRSSSSSHLPASQWGYHHGDERDDHDAQRSRPNRVLPIRHVCGESADASGVRAVKHDPQERALGTRVDVGHEDAPPDQPNRLLDDVQVNERRTGGRIHSIYNYDYTDLYDLSQLLVLKHARVWIDPEEGATSLTDITSVETGPAIVRRATAGLLPADLLLEGRILWGRDHKNELLYSRVRLGGRWHYPFGAGFAINTEIYGEWASQNVPIFERPSLGGSLSVRGYRLDALLGRTHLTGQQELWVPVPGTMSAGDGIGAILRRNLRFAAFIDAAAIGSTSISNPDQSGIRTGAGLGLRIRAGRMTLRADWGHRLVDIGEGNFRGNFFLSIRPDLFLFF